MTVVAYPKDVTGKNLQTQATSLRSTANTATGASAAALAAAADQAERELVQHYLMNGRLTAQNILSTMT